MKRFEIKCKMKYNTDEHERGYVEEVIIILLLLEFIKKNDIIKYVF